jgi:hypothetical protein
LWQAFASKFERKVAKTAGLSRILAIFQSFRKKV